MSGLLLCPLAVHIADQVLAGPWVAAGFAGAAVLVLFGSWRIRDEAIPEVALLTAAFFVASLIHVRAGPSSVHLLFNGLVGVLLGRHAALAIPVGVFLQAVLVGHGGYSTIGVNSCVMALPALVSWQLFTALHGLAWSRRRWFRSALTGGTVFAWVLALVFSIALIAANGVRPLSRLDAATAVRIILHPVTLAAAVAAAAAAVVAERRLEETPEFPLGLLVGSSAVILTTLLAGVVLVEGGEEDWPSLVLLLLLPHLVIALLEGIILGFVVSFLAQVKPQMLRRSTPEEVQCLAGPPA